MLFGLGWTGGAVRCEWVGMLAAVVFPSAIRGNTWAIDLLARRVHLCRGLQRVSVQGDTVGPVRNHSHGVACGRREPISWSGGAWQEHRCHVMGARHPPLQSLVAHHASRRQATTQGAKPHTAGPAVCGEGQGGRRRPSGGPGWPGDFPIFRSVSCTARRQSGNCDGGCL